MKYYEVRNVSRVYDLTPLPNQSVKSFYGKAKVLITDTKEYLQSYDEIVAVRDKTTNQVTRVWDSYSNTTGRHISAFLGQKTTKKEWESLPVDSGA